MRRDERITACLHSGAVFHICCIAVFNANQVYVSLVLLFQQWYCDKTQPPNAETVISNIMALGSFVFVTTNTLNCLFNPYESAWFISIPSCIANLIGPDHGSLTKCLMFFGHLVDLVQWFNQWRIKFGSLPEDLIRCQWNEAICWECVSEVAMLQTDNPMLMSPVVSPITVVLETDHHGYGLLQSHVSLALCL